MTRYHIGTLPHCPAQNVTCNGITFPGYTGVAGSGGEITEGAIVELSDDDAKALKAALAERELRVSTTGSIGILRKGDRADRGPAIAKRIPLVRCVYMRRAP